MDHICRSARRSPRNMLLALAALVVFGVLTGCDATPQLLRGTVTTPGGTPAAGVGVTLHTQDGDQVAAATTTNLFGTYEFRASSGLSDGVYRLTVDQPADDGVVTVSTGATATHDVELYDQAATVSGTVVDATGMPVAAAPIGAYRVDTQSFVALSATEADGTFQVDVIEAGTYQVRLTHPDHGLVVVGGDQPAEFQLILGTTNIGTIHLATGAITPPAFKAVAAGSGHTCAIAADDTLDCWGSDTHGRATPPLGTYTMVTAGHDHSCALATDSTISCWGSNEFGQITPPAGTYQSISAETRSNCALATDDTITCWGENWSGQTDSPAGSYKRVTAGNDFSCAIALDDMLTCWGGGYEGQSTPPAGSFQTVDAGGSHACAVAIDGAISCWGDNLYDVVAVPPPGTFKALSAGYFTSCAIGVDDTLDCWGPDGSSNLDDAPTGTYLTVSSGQAHNCAIATDETITCWGENAGGPASPPSGG